MFKSKGKFIPNYVTDRKILRKTRTLLMSLMNAIFKYLFTSIHIHSVAKGNLFVKAS